MFSLTKKKAGTSAAARPQHAAASDAFRGALYFGGLGVGTGVLKLLGWLAVGAGLLALGWFKHQRGRQQVTPAGDRQAGGAANLTIAPVTKEEHHGKDRA